MKCKGVQRLVAFLLVVLILSSNTFVFAEDGLNKKLEDSKNPVERLYEEDAENNGEDIDINDEDAENNEEDVDIDENDTGNSEEDIVGDEEEVEVEGENQNTDELNNTYAEEVELQQDAEISDSAWLQEQIDDTSAAGTINLDKDLILDKTIIMYGKGMTIDGGTEGHTISLAPGLTGRHFEISGVNRDVTFKNITFMGHNNTAPGTENGERIFGGGITVRDTSRSVVLENCAFIGNHFENYGGAIYLVNNISLNAVNTTFENNSSTGDGGAIYGGGKIITLDNCEALNNSAYGGNGGFIYTRDSTWNITKSKFNSNFASVNGGAISTDSTNPRDFSLSESTLENNKAEKKGGALELSGSTWSDKVKVEECIFDGNEAQDGGAVALHGKARFNGDTFKNNTALGNNGNNGKGGAIYTINEGLGYPYIYIDGSTFEGNSAAAGIYWDLNNPKSAPEEYAGYGQHGVVFGYIHESPTGNTETDSYVERIQNVNTCSQAIDSGVTYTNIFNNLDIIFTTNYKVRFFKEIAIENGVEKRIESTLFFKNNEKLVAPDGYEESEGKIFKGWQIYHNDNPKFTNRGWIPERWDTTKPYLWNDKEMELTGDLYLVALWAYVGEVTYVLNDGSGSTEIVEYEKDVDMVIPTLKEVNENWTPAKGKAFKGWNTEADGSGTEYTAGSGMIMPDSITLYAQWIEVPVNEYVVNFDSAGGSAVTPQTVEEGKAATKPVNPTKSGYVFKEWQLDGVLYDFATPVTKEITLVAIWTPDTPQPGNTFRVRYYGNGETSGTAPVDSTLYNSNDIVRVEGRNTLRKDNYTFIGWSTNRYATRAEYKVGDTFRINADTDLYAVWEKDDDNSGGWTWGGSSTSATSEEKPKTEELTHKSYLNGYPDNTIRPQGNITRAEVAVAFARLKMNSEDITYKTETNYSDVDNSDWYAKYVAFVTDNKIMKGYEDGSFKANEQITRAEFATVVARYNNLSDIKSNFKDVSGHWAEGYVGSVENKGWIIGYPDGTFKPEKDISREEIATMVNRMADRKVDKEGLNNLPINKFKDLDENSWSYYDIVEASNSHKSVRRNEYSNVENWIQLIY